MRADPRRYSRTVERMLHLSGAMDLADAVSTLRAFTGLPKGTAVDAIRFSLNSGLIRMVKVGTRFIFASGRRSR